MTTINDAAKRAYGALWRDPSPSAGSKIARGELFKVLSHEERREGIAWTFNMFGPMTDSEMISADIRVGVFPEKSIEASPQRVATASTPSNPQTPDQAQP